MSSSRTEQRLVDVTMPQMGVSVAEGTVVDWRKQLGDRVEADETICEISTDKIDTEVPVAAPARGRDPGAGRTRRSTSARCSRGSRRLAVGRRRSRRADAEPPAEAPSRRPRRAAANGRRRHRRRRPRRRSRRYSPVVQRIAAEHDIDLDAGPGHRARRPRAQAGRARVSSRRLGAAVEEPPLHIECPYRPDPVAGRRRAGAGGCGRRRRSSRGCAARSAST